MRARNGTARSLFVICALVAAARAPALPSPFLVKDINTAPVIFSSNPRQFATLGERAFFVADTPSGSGLWRTDGTAAGTVLVKTIDVVGNLVGVNGRLFFVARDPSSGAELWRSDGTPDGTALVRDINPGPLGAFDSDERANSLAAVGDVLFFAADDGVHGSGLWRSDGRADGTVLVRAVGASGLSAVGDLLLFVGSDAAHGNELWRSDGTADGTVLVRDINPGPNGSDPLLITDVDGTAFFRARDEQHGDELWTSDGTEAGTMLVRDINPGGGGSFPEDLAAVNGELFFRAEDDGVDPRQLWKSDGTAAGTVRVRRFEGVGYSVVGSLVGLGDTLIFVQDEGSHGLELWRSDGTETGTLLIKDIKPGGEGSVPSLLTVVDGALFFIADDGVHGAELWRSDGTAGGTVLVQDVNPGPAPAASNYADTLVAVGDHLVFAADDGAHGVELWASDGSDAGTALVKDVWPGPATAGASPASFTPLGDTLFFTADTGSGLRELWRSNGTEAGTVRVADITDINSATPRASERQLAVLGGRLFFGARTRDGVDGNELWSSDGTAGGTALVKDIWPGPDQGDPGELTVVGEALFFAASDNVHGRELWRSDGTAAGTALLADVAPGLEGSEPDQLTAVDGRLFFTVGARNHTQLWVSDGTTAGTVLLKLLFFATNLTDVAGTLYFTTATTLWKSDGTAAGTVMLGDFHPVSGQYTPNQLTAVGADLFFVAQLGVPVRLFVVGADHNAALLELDKFSPSELTGAAGRLFFRTGDPEHGSELWTSDGSVEGTQLVRDINPGPGSSNPGALSPDVGRLLFSACDAETCNLWESDGTASGTRPLADLAGLGTSSFVTVGSLAFFSAANLDIGAELWAVSLSGDVCVGDCNGDRMVTIAELVRMVRAVLGQTDDALGCVGGADGNGQVTIDLLVAAVNHALTGCPAAAPSPTPTAPGTPTPTPTDPPGCCVCTTTIGAARARSFIDCMHTAGCGWFDDACHCASFCPTPA